MSADMGKIQQVLYNLIDNAIKFSRPDSTIFIETTERHEKVFVSVKDTGRESPKTALKKSGSVSIRQTPPGAKIRKAPDLGWQSQRKSYRPTTKTSMW